MNIFANTVVTLTFELFDADGTLLEAAAEPITYLHGGYSGMLPKLEEALNHKQAGDAISVTLEPADAFGDYDAELVKIESADRFPAEIEVGHAVRGPRPAPTSTAAAASSPSPTSPTARSCSTATIPGPASRCASTAGSSRCARRPPRRSSTATCTGRTGITTDAARPRRGRGSAGPPRAARRRAITRLDDRRRRPRPRRSSRSRRLSSYSASSASRGVSASGSSAASAARSAASAARPARHPPRCSPTRRARAPDANRSCCGDAAGVELVEPREIAARAADRLGRHAGELRHLQAVAAARRPVRDRVQEHDAVARARRRRSGRWRSPRSRPAARSARSSAWRRAPGCGSSRRGDARSPTPAPGRRRSTCRGRSRRSAPGSAASRGAGSPRPRSSRP